jgi:hypothetical protein
VNGEVAQCSSYFQAHKPECSSPLFGCVLRDGWGGLGRNKVVHVRMETAAEWSGYLGGELIERAWRRGRVVTLYEGGAAAAKFGLCMCAKPGKVRGRRRNTH